MTPLMNLFLTSFPSGRTSVLRLGLAALGMVCLFPGGSFASAGSEDEKRPSIAEPYGVERYKKLWSTPLFNVPVKVEAPKVAPAPAAAPAVSGFTLRGIAEVQGTQYVYLEDRTGTLHELPVNQPVGDLEVTKITLGDQAATHSVSLRSGANTFVLQFDLTTQPSPPAPVKADRDADPAASARSPQATSEDRSGGPRAPTTPAGAAEEVDESVSELEWIDEEDAEVWIDEEDTGNESSSKVVPRDRRWRSQRAPSS